MSAENPTDITATPPAQGPTDVTAAPASVPPALTLPDGPAPAPRPAVAPERLLRRLARLDLFLLVLLLLLAFGTASFPARNTDLLLHMATGRALLRGDYTFGTDPFAHNTEGVYWVNHGWLADLGAYAAWSVAGIPGLIVLKALLVTATALVMVRLGQPSRMMWVPVLCATPAILRLSTRVLLQSICISYLFLALTVYFLQRGGGWLNGGEPAPTTPVTWRRYWPLLPLFVLWVNLDEWFFLGPLTVALYLVGQWIQASTEVREVTRRPRRAGEVGSLGIVLVLGLLACCVNPHHVRVFTELPVLLGLSPAAAAMRSDPVLRTLFYSSFHSSFFGGQS